MYVKEPSALIVKRRRPPRCSWFQEGGFKSQSWHLCPKARYFIAASFGWDLKPLVLCVGNVCKRTQCTNRKKKSFPQCSWFQESGFKSQSWRLCPKAKHFMAASFGWDLKPLVLCVGNKCKKKAFPRCSWFDWLHIAPQHLVITITWCFVTKENPDNAPVWPVGKKRRPPAGRLFNEQD